MEQMDAIVIGSGQGGVPLAEALARDGKAVTLFERGAFGGSCINYGCIPSKAFLASAHAAGRARGSNDLGIHAEVQVDFPAVMQRVRDIVESSAVGVEQRLEEAGVRLVRAEASFTGERTVAAGGVTVRAPLVVINTGNSPAVPDIPGLKETPCLTYLNFWELEQLPARLLVIGGGYVGLELGQGMARLGSETHVIEVMERIISVEEPEVSKLLTEALEADGVHFHLDVEVSNVAYADGVFTLTLDDGQSLHGEALLVAAGQQPNTQALNTQAAGIELNDRGFINVDDRFQTTNSGVYAIGDVTGQPAFTHVSWEDHRRLLAILNGDGRRQGDRVLGYAFFTAPQVGRAGLTMEAAEQNGFDARAVTLPLRNVARANVSNRLRGFYRMVIDAETDEILGATLVGPEAAELIHVFIAHMEAGSTWQTLERSVHIHPTYGEGLPSLARRLKEDHT